MAASERQRLTAEAARRDREHRQGVYHDFLNALSRVDALATVATAEEYDALSSHAGGSRGRGTFLSVLVQARNLLNGVLLFGTPEVVAAAESSRPCSQRSNGASRRPQC
jgi:hypothetical protein